MADQIAAWCDIGGTKALLGLVDESGQILARDRYLLGGPRDPQDIVIQMTERLKLLVDRSGQSWDAVAGIGCSAAVMCNIEKGIVLTAPNLIGDHRNVPLREMLEDATQKSTVIEMDAYASALGEAWQGVGRGVDYFVYVVVGTGIGSGILLHGEVFRGWHGTAGEFGHMSIDPNGPLCNCGRYGCLEAFAAGPAIAARAQAAIWQNRPTILTQKVGGDGITPEIVFNAARDGDEVALEVVRHTTEYLAIGLSNLIHLLNPQVIALGGGVVRGGADLLLQPLQQEVSRRCGSWVDLTGLHISISALGEDAGLLGAASLVWQRK